MKLATDETSSVFIKRWAMAAPEIFIWEYNPMGVWDFTVLSCTRLKVEHYN